MNSPRQRRAREIALQGDCFFEVRPSLMEFRLLKAAVLLEFAPLERDLLRLT